MRRFLVLSVLLVLLITACSSMPPAGNYLIVPLTVTGTWEPDYTFCQYGQCWNAQIANGAYAPTAEVVPTEIPTAVPQTCAITPKDSNINVRSAPSTTASIVALMRVGYETQALALSNGFYKIWWPGDSDFPTPTYGWTYASYYTTTGVCSNLPNS